MGIRNRGKNKKMSSLELEYTLAGRPQLLVIINLFFFFPHSSSATVPLIVGVVVFVILSLFGVCCKMQAEDSETIGCCQDSDVNANHTTPYHRARCDTSSTPAAGIKSLPSPSYGFRSCAVQRIFTTPGVPISIGVTTTLP